MVIEIPKLPGPGSLTPWHSSRWLAGGALANKAYSNQMLSSEMEFTISEWQRLLAHRMDVQRSKAELFWYFHQEGKSLLPESLHPVLFGATVLRLRVTGRCSPHRVALGPVVDKPASLHCDRRWRGHSRSRKTLEFTKGKSSGNQGEETLDGGFRTLMFPPPALLQLPQGGCPAARWAQIAQVDASTGTGTQAPSLLQDRVVLSDKPLPTVSAAPVLPSWVVECRPPDIVYNAGKRPAEHVPSRVKMLHLWSLWILHTNRSPGREEKPKIRLPGFYSSRCQPGSLCHDPW